MFIDILIYTEKGGGNFFFKPQRTNSPSMFARMNEEILITKQKIKIKGKPHIYIYIYIRIYIHVCVCVCVCKRAMNKYPLGFCGCPCVNCHTRGNCANVNFCELLQSVFVAFFLSVNIMM